MNWKRILGTYGEVLRSSNYATAREMMEEPLGGGPAKRLADEAGTFGQVRLRHDGLRGSVVTTFLTAGGARAGNAAPRKTSDH